MRKWLINFCIIFGMIAIISTPALAKDRFITVTFKAGTDAKFVSIINLMFRTKTVEQLNSTTYRLKLPKFKKPHQFAELFSSLSYVKKTKPAPRYNLADHITMQAITVPNDTQKSKEVGVLGPVALKSNKIQSKVNKRLEKYNQQALATTNVPLTGGNQMLVTFKPGSTKNIIEIFNLIFESEVVEKKSFREFLIQLPSHINPTQAERIFKLSPYVINAQRLYS